MKKRFTVLIMVSLILILVLTSCGLVGEIKTVGDTGKEFMTALKNSDYTASWNMLAPAVQSEIGNETAWAEWASIRNFPEWKFTNTEVDNNQAQMDGEASLDGITYQVTLVFDKIDGVWKVSGINFQ